MPSPAALSALPPALRSTSILRTAPTWSRGIQSSRVVRDSHGHGHAAEGPAAPETFFSPMWRNTLILTTLTLLIYPFLPSPPSAPLSPSANPNYSSETSKDLPLVSRVLAQITPPASLWQQRNDKHLEQSVVMAEDKLLFQEAEMPRVHRMRNPTSFENASPRCIAVGSQTDLTDLVVKGDAASGLKKA